MDTTQSIASTYNYNNSGLKSLDITYKHLTVTEGFNDHWPHDQLEFLCNDYGDKLSLL